uniref:Thioredoxin domain-containing protein n=2 Tax=Clastoptera arizonana TaxID=38151 RepID=A0A1B6E4C2_9HEMI
MSQLLKIFLIFFSYGIYFHTSNAEDKNISSEVKQEVELNDQNEPPSDVSTVSKFIQEFHRKIEGNSYPTNEKIESASRIVKQNEPEVEYSVVPETENDENQTETNNATSSVINCKTDRLPGSLTVELVNSTRLMNLLTSDANITSRLIQGECLMLLFYANTCPFSCMAAPHFNALPRAFPSVKMAAINAFTHPSFNTQFGIVGVPTVVLYHNGRPAAKFNDSEYTLEMFARFITRITGVHPEEKMFVTSADFGGPVPSVLAKETDYYLGLSWAVIAAIGGIGIARSKAWRAIVEAVQNTWREAEAQHFHVD